MTIARRVSAFQTATAPFLRFFSDSTWSRRRAEPDIADFVFGNPHEQPLQGFVDGLQRALPPQHNSWFAYQMSEPASQAVIAASLRQWRNIPFEPDDILMTTGAFSAISIILNTLVEPGDEVIFNTPPWFFYEGLIATVGGVPVKVKVRADNFDLDLAAIEKAITPKTRVVLVNSPNNPTGKIYPESTLKALAELLETASKRIGHTIYLLSDEAYSRIIYDGQSYPSPTAYYANTLLVYTYGKTLLTPGQRLGYIALPPSMPDRPALRDALFSAQIFLGYAFPNALLQHAIADIDKLSIDIEHLQEKRDRMVSGLRNMGYDVHVPEGTFYLLPRSPLPDDWAFNELLAEQKVFCLPGAVVELPGYFRISLTANDQMIDRAMPGFEAAFNKAAKERING